MVWKFFGMVSGWLAWETQLSERASVLKKKSQMWSPSLMCYLCESQFWCQFSCFKQSRANDTTTKWTKTQNFLIPGCCFFLFPLYCFVLISFISDLKCGQHRAVQYVSPSWSFFCPTHWSIKPYRNKHSRTFSECSTLSKHFSVLRPSLFRNL